MDAPALGPISSVERCMIVGPVTISMTALTAAWCSSLRDCRCGGTRKATVGPTDGSRFALMLQTTDQWRAKGANSVPTLRDELLAQYFHVLTVGFTAHLAQSPPFPLPRNKDAENKVRLKFP